MHCRSSWPPYCLPYRALVEDWVDGFHGTLSLVGRGWSCRGACTAHTHMHVRPYIPLLAPKVLASMKCELTRGSASWEPGLNLLQEGLGNVGNGQRSISVMPSMVIWRTDNLGSSMLASTDGFWSTPVPGSQRENSLQMLRMCCVLPRPLICRDPNDLMEKSSN